MATPRARAAACLVAAAALMSLAACDPKSDPITPRGAGFQQTADGKLAIWFGEPCRDVVEVRLELSRSKDDDGPAMTYDLRAPGYVPSQELPAKPPPSGSGVPVVDGLTLGSPVKGLETRSSLPAGFEWRDFYAVDLLVKTSGGQAGTYLVTKRLKEESADHPDEFYVQDQGWFDKAAFGKAGGGDFKALCSSINP